MTDHGGDEKVNLKLEMEPPPGTHLTLGPGGAEQQQKAVDFTPVPRGGRVAGW